jgi:ATP-binding cassette subfamily F protein 3
MGGVAAAPARTVPVENDRDRRRREAAARDALAAKLRPIKAAIADLERRIAELETEKKQIEPKLVDPSLYADFARSRPLLQRYDEIREKLDELYARWEHQHQALASHAGGEVGD